jgi:signal transduction histidine kinase/CheY-like chemotaxis protein
MEQQNRQKLKRKIRINSIILLAFSLAMLLGAFFMRERLIKNAKKLSVLLLDNYGNDEENTFQTYQTLLSLATLYVDNKEMADTSVEKIKEGVYPYLDGFCNLYHGDNVRCYGVIGGTMISNEESKEQSFKSGDYSETDWYQGAIRAKGDTYVTDAYEDDATGEVIVTLSQKAAHSDSVMAFDLFFDRYHTGDESLQLPEDGAYYLCDRNGTLLYYDSFLYDTYEGAQGFADKIHKQMDAGSSAWYLENYDDVRGVRRSAFTRQLDNGWFIILTTPRKNVLGGMRTLYLVIGGIFLLGASVILYMAVRDYHQERNNLWLKETSRDIAHTNEIFQKTMESTMKPYRAIYYVDLQKDTYQVVYPVSRWGERGAYQTGMQQKLEGGLFREDDRERAAEFLRLDHVTKELLELEFIEERCHLKLEQGGYETYSMTFFVVERKKGKPCIATLAVRSIENMIRQEELQKQILTVAVERAETANHAKSDFLSNMSHDIRTPMNAIMGMTAIASMHIDNKDRVRDALDKISVSGKHLLGLINSVLDMSKIESGTVILEEKEFLLPDCVESLLALFQTQILQKNQDFQVKMEGLTHERVIGDPERLQQIFVNILGNAVKFTPPGGKISLSVREKSSSASGRSCYECVFRDNGIGMSPEFVDKIFEPFSRAADSRTEGIEGYGLGMSIAVSLARLMGGDIRVESSPGEGSTFTVTVYLKYVLSSPDAPVEEESALECFTRQNYDGKTILLVEDNQLNREVATEILETVGIRIEIAQNGKEAVEILEEKPAGYFDAVLMDIQMPVMNGYEAAKKIRASRREDLKKIPMIAMTADAFAEDVRKATKAGMDGHVAKPIDLVKLQGYFQKFWNEK